MRNTSAVAAVNRDKQAFVEDLAREHGQRLRRFLASRLRYASSDVSDLVQEVYLRLLRIPNQESIRSPQAYMFTIAFHVLHQHKLALATAPEAIDPIAMMSEFDTQSQASSDPAALVEAEQRLRQLDGVLRQLPPNAYVSFVLQRRFGLSLEEIASELGVSRAMIKKHIARALAHCREHLPEFSQDGRWPA
jgi:RNA polymerase sigma-70 factor (ECF subfamily)